MNEHEKSNTTFKQIFASFETFILILEHPNWTRTAKVEEIKKAFKLGSFIEKTIKHFSDINCLPNFLTVLKNQLTSKNINTNIYNKLDCASDYLFRKFFVCEKIPEKTLDIATRMYVSIFPKNRLENVLHNLILTSKSYEAVIEFSQLNMNYHDCKNLDYYLKLRTWCYFLNIGQKELLQDELNTSMSIYKVESSLHILIGVLSIDECSDEEIYVRNMILDILTEKMSDRSVLSKTFWSTLCINVDKNYISKTCSKHKDFLNNLFKFIVFIGSMMKYENEEWISNSDISLCPEISYYHIFDVVKAIYKLPDLREVVIEKLVEAKDCTGCFIWDKIREEL